MSKSIEFQRRQINEQINWLKLSLKHKETKMERLSLDISFTKESIIFYEKKLEELK